MIAADISTDIFQESDVYEFQKASIDAIAACFERQDKVLCADEAGLGKTHIAKGVISKFAKKKCLINKKTCDIGGYIRFFLELINNYREAYNNGSANNKKNIKEKITSLIKLCFPDLERGFEKEVQKRIDLGIKYLKEAFEHKTDLDKWQNAYYKFAANVRTLTVIREKNQRLIKIRLPKLPEEPLRVLYICCNLAIAQQNVSKISPIPQLHSECDRLSTAWWYSINHPTPLIDVYTITASIISNNTSGTEDERRILSQLAKLLNDETDYDIKKANPVLIEKYRSKSELLSLRVLKPDLIIMDEFQNFGQVVKLINGEEFTFTDCNENDAKDKYERLKLICETLYSKNTKQVNDIRLKTALKKKLKLLQKNKTSGMYKLLRGPLPRTGAVSKKNNENYRPKTLILSATPFHDEDEKNSAKKATQLTYYDIIKFLTDKEPDKGCLISSGDIENYLMKNGFLRNERSHLLGDRYINRFKIHRIECSSRGLLTASSAFRNCENIQYVATLLKSTPCMIYFCKKYGKEYFGFDLPKESDLTDAQKALLYYDKSSSGEVSHGKYQAFRKIACSNDAADDGILQDLSIDLEKLKKVLWIPPSLCSRPLDEPFKFYAKFSKTLAFTEHNGTPQALAALLNDTVTYLPCDIPEKIDIPEIKGWFDIFKSSEITAEQLYQDFIRMLRLIGGNALGDRPSEEDILKYCRAGCLEDVLKEYYFLCKSKAPKEDRYNKFPAAELKNVFQYIIWEAENGDNNKTFAKAITIDDLYVGDLQANFRRNFNSPFIPFIGISTSIGAEGLDFHLYCNRLVHYDIPRNPISFEQKNGRIDRRDSLAVRRNWLTSLIHKYNEEYDAISGDKLTWDSLSEIIKRIEKQNKTKEYGYGLIPRWDCGEENLHIYFLQYPQAISEDADKIDKLLEWTNSYRGKMGTNFDENTFALNLSPVCHLDNN